MSRSGYEPPAAAPGVALGTPLCPTGLPCTPTHSHSSPTKASPWGLQHALILLHHASASKPLSRHNTQGTHEAARDGRDHGVHAVLEALVERLVAPEGVHAGDGAARGSTEDRGSKSVLSREVASVHL